MAGFNYAQEGAEKPASFYGTTGMESSSSEESSSRGEGSRGRTLAITGIVLALTAFVGMTSFSNRSHVTEMEQQETAAPAAVTAAAEMTEERTATSTTVTLDFSVTNSYTEEYGHPGKLYPWLNSRRVVEPYKKTFITPRLSGDSTDDDIASCDYTITAASTTAPGTTYHGRHGIGAELEKVFTRTSIHLETMFGSPGDYTLELECTTTAGNTYTTTDTLRSFYVRRELRNLNEEDRERFLDAMLVTANTQTPAGQALYGSEYKSLEYFEAMHLDKAGARMADKIHDGMGVVTQHVAITQEYELSLQTVDPSVTMPYWDYTIDSMQAKMRGKVDNSIFTDSKLFSADFFGTTHGTEHYIADGRFEKQQVATTNSSDQIQSPFGYLRAPWNLNPSPYVSRYHKMCGMSIEKIYDESLKGITDLHWPTCKAHYSLTFGEDTQTWYDWVWSSSYLPHGPVHAWIGGIYGEECGSKMQALKSFMGDKDVARTSLYLFTLLKNMWRDELIEFPNYCSLDSIEDCAVVCTREDPQFYLKFKHYFANNDVRIVGGMDKHELDAVSDLALCDNTYWPGDHLEAASPVDVSFWPIHPTLDRLLQFKQLTTPFTDTTWDFSEDDDDSKSYCTTHESNHCFGHHQYDLTFWKSAYYDDEVGGYKTEYLTNGEIFRIINPNTYSAPYIYDNFEWDHCAEAGVSFKHAGYHYEGRNNEGQPM